jgi:hypothetical protein
VCMCVCVCVRMRVLMCVCKCLCYKCGLCLCACCTHVSLSTVEPRSDSGLSQVETLYKNLCTRDTIQKTIRTSYWGQPLYKDQSRLSQSVLYSEVPLYIRVYILCLVRSMSQGAANTANCCCKIHADTKMFSHLWTHWSIGILQLNTKRIRRE